jgi:sigma-B regulation protein RsbQ
MAQAASEDILARHHARVSGTGPVLVYAHGFGCSQGMWDAILPAFAATHRQVAFDYIGAGRSDRSAYDPRRYARLEGHAEDLLAVCRAVAPPEGVVLVAHSVSCSIGMIAAGREPGLFRDLVLLGPNPCFVNDPPDYLGGFERSELEGLLALMDQNYLGWANTLAPLVAGEGGGPAVASRLSESFCSTDPVVARQFAEATFFADNRGDVARVRTPSLVLQHRHDSLAPMAVGRWLQARLPDCTLEVLDVAGHCAHMSHPALVIDVLRRRLGR